MLLSLDATTPRLRRDADDDGCNFLSVPSRRLKRHQSLSAVVFCFETTARGFVDEIYVQQVVTYEGNLTWVV